MPTTILAAQNADGTPIAPTVRDTWVVLRALAKGQDQLDATFAEIASLTGKSRSQIMSHLALLRDRYGLRFRTAGSLLLQVLTFGDGLPAGTGLSGFPDKDSPPDGDQVDKVSSGYPDGPDSPSSTSSDLQLEEGGGAVRKSGSRVRETLHPAIAAYRSAAAIYPDKAWWDDIISAVGRDVESLRRWHDTVHAYVGCGWSKRNVKVMLEYFGRGEIPGTRRAAPPTQANGRSNGHGPPARTPAPSPDEVEALRAQLREHRERLKNGTPSDAQ